ncbi:MAG: PrsW family glutamic-type intramembrane protease [Caldilineaceae bacterium]
MARDGFIYGALIGLGFNWLESAVYIAQGFAQSGVVPWAFQLLALCPAGTGRPCALYQHHRHLSGLCAAAKSHVRKLTLPILGYILAVLSHMTWNSLGVMLSGILTSVVGSQLLGESGRAIVAAGDPAAFPLWVSWPANAIATIVAGFVAYLIVIIGLRRSGRWEKHVMAEQLQDDWIHRW